MKRLSVSATALASIALIFTACSVPNETPPPTETSTAKLKPDTSDGKLLIGTLYPTLEQNTVANALITAVETAVRDINQDGGLHLSQGEPGELVRVVHKNGGTTSESVTKAFEALADAGVDAVLAPIDPALTEVLLPLAEAKGIAFLGVGANQPDATLGADGYYLTKATELAGFGRYLALTTDGPLTIFRLDSSDVSDIALGFDSIRELQFAEGSTILDFSEAESEISTAVVGGHYLIVTSDVNQSTAFIPKLQAVGATNDQISVFGAFSANLGSTDLKEKVEGINLYRNVIPFGTFREHLLASNPWLGSWGELAETYDLVVIAALASLTEIYYGDETRSTEPTAVEGGGAIVTGAYLLSEGFECFSYSECSWVMAAGQAIKYIGPSGVTIFNNSGNSIFSSFEHFTYTDLGILNRLDLVAG
ncbi:MAG: hypothetical protein KF916_02650 [Microbacteriaceae bacterium]|nr:hypothetical protein [Microbacteriaceae bacterium]